MPYCAKCGESVRGGDSFFSNCGAELVGERPFSRRRSRTEETRECPKCHGKGWVNCATCQGRGEMKKWWPDPLTGKRLYKWVQCDNRDCQNGRVKCRYPGCNEGYI